MQHNVNPEYRAIGKDEDMTADIPGQLENASDLDSAREPRMSVSYSPPVNTEVAK